MEFTEENQRKTGTMEVFLYEGLCPNTMKEENQDPDPLEQSGVKEEVEPEPCQVKEEDPNSYYYRRDIKEEVADRGYSDCDVATKEEKPQPEFLGQEPDYAAAPSEEDPHDQSSDLSRWSRQRFPPGPDMQVSVYQSSCSGSDPGSSGHFSRRTSPRGNTRVFAPRRLSFVRNERLLLPFPSGRV